MGLKHNSDINIGLTANTVDQQTYSPNKISKEVMWQLLLYVN